MALVLLTWATAGMSLEQPFRVSPFGLPFRVARPELLPLGLALATLYGALRYYYYAMMLGTSPYRRRRDLLDQLHETRGEKERRVGPARKAAMYFGPSEFTSSPWTSNKQDTANLGEEIRKAFPKFARARVTAKVLHDVHTDDTGEYSIYALKLSIPMHCRLAAMLHDLDYSSPVWFGLLSLLAWLRAFP